ncbi:hypothetical protein AKJ16_DCAP02211 [Drosera capensis]
MDAETLPSKWQFTCNLEVDYESGKKASIVHSALAVDRELQPDTVKRQVTVSDGKLSVHFEAVEARFLRASFSALLLLMFLHSPPRQSKSSALEQNIKIHFLQ